MPFCRASVVLLVSWLALGCDAGLESGKPCLVWSENVRPLLVGDSVVLRAGTTAGSDCNPNELYPASFQWRSGDSTFVAVRVNSTLRGVAPGIFHAVGVRGTDTLHAEGFVLPRGWRIRVAPESVTVHVGDTVSFAVRAHDSSGRVLPPVPFSIYTEQYVAFGRAVRAGVEQPPMDSALTDKWSQQQIVVPGVFRALRPGIATMTAQLGPQQAEARLVVIPAASHR